MRLQIEVEAGAHSRALLNARHPSRSSAIRGGSSRCVVSLATAASLHERAQSPLRVREEVVQASQSASVTFEGESGVNVSPVRKPHSSRDPSGRCGSSGSSSEMGSPPSVIRHHTRSLTRSSASYAALELEEGLQSSHKPSPATEGKRGRASA